MLQEILVGLSFAGAIYYLVRTYFWPSSKASGCAGGCQQCQTIDFEQIAKKIANEQPSVVGVKGK